MKTDINAIAVGDVVYHKKLTCYGRVLEQDGDTLLMDWSDEQKPSKSYISVFLSEGFDGKYLICENEKELLMINLIYG